MAEPSYWLSALAEELAEFAQERDAASLTAMLKKHAAWHRISERDLTAMVAAEWHRQGIVTVPTEGILRGWMK